jgi:hypothetical protein
METFDVCVLLFTGLATGFTLGFSVRSRRFRNLESELEWERIKYGKLVDTYTDCIVEIHKLKYESYLKPIPPVKKEGVVFKKKAGRPKGSTNKPKQDGKPTTRKYTRKSSK